MGDQVEPIFKAIEFIEGHLNEDLTVAQIAEATGYSLFHFMRKFNQMVHHTPYDYLMRRRLSEAARTLVQSDLRIIDIAFDHGFKDQETFSRVFRRMFQMTPSQCRRQNGVSTRCLMAAKTMDDLLFMNSDHFRPPRIMELPGLELYGLMTGSVYETDKRMRSVDGLIKDLKSLSGLKANSELYIIWFCLEEERQDCYQYLGAESNRFEEVSPVLVSSILPAGCALCMDIPESELTLARSFLYSSWMPGAGLEEKDDRQILRLNMDSDGIERSLTILIPLKESSRIKGDQGDTL